MTKESKTAFEKRMKKITVPEGFTSKFDTQKYGHGKFETITHIFVLEKPNDTKITFDHTGGGHTEYFHSDGFWSSFDRTGVSDSFYHAKLFSGDKPLPLDQIVTEQLALIAKKREYNKTAVRIPGIPFTTSPEGVKGLKDRLVKGGHVTFTPSGFGTGYCVTKKPTRNCQFGEERAKKETEEFFGLSPLYVHTLDCD